MQILFVHPNFPAQFGPALRQLAGRGDLDCVFVSRTGSGAIEGVRRIPFELRGGATRANHYCSRSFENAIWSAHGVYEACKSAPGLRPDLVVGHSGFGTTLFLRELYSCPIVNYFEHYYHAHGSDLDFRPDFPPDELDFLRSHARNAMILLDLEGCAAGWTPTQWQQGLFPVAHRPKLEVIHDGIDTQFWRRRPVERRIGAERVPDDTRIVTYVARGLEAMRGFDIFVRMAKRIAERRADVLFVVVGSDRSHYGNDRRHVGATSFREHVLATEQPDLSRFRFLGTIAPEALADLFSLSDLHVYLTVPFVASWSLLDALACECVVLASDTAPVREFVEHERTGLLADFFDVDALADQALRVLREPSAHRFLGAAGRACVEARCAASRTAPRLRALFERIVAARGEELGAGGSGARGLGIGASGPVPDDGRSANG
jgi:glycosyltransferase involved in cell wall biosynthesis